ncbi:hypothetical protein BFZC1_07238 [Lysinibacillus fusiformis ZC1]|nr:hypothetical protein BFZC1_07238 [Lysinibacillus fusiformis ZC1]
MRKLFRHPTRQLTSSAKAKEVVIDHHYEHAFCHFHALIVGLFIMPFNKQLFTIQN